jgi:hypothetical protein
LHFDLESTYTMCHAKMAKRQAKPNNDGRKSALLPEKLSP